MHLIWEMCLAVELRHLEEMAADRALGLIERAQTRGSPDRRYPLRDS